MSHGASVVPLSVSYHECDQDEDYCAAQIGVSKMLRLAVCIVDYGQNQLLLMGKTWPTFQMALTETHSMQRKHTKPTSRVITKWTRIQHVLLFRVCSKKVLKYLLLAPVVDLPLRNMLGFVSLPQFKEESC